MSLFCNANEPRENYTILPSVKVLPVKTYVDILVVAFGVV